MRNLRKSEDDRVSPNLGAPSILIAFPQLSLGLAAFVPFSHPAKPAGARQSTKVTARAKAAVGTQRQPEQPQPEDSGSQSGTWMATPSSQLQRLQNAVAHVQTRQHQQQRLIANNNTGWKSLSFR